MARIKWTKQQNEALNLMFAWLRTRNRKPIFYLAGFAGTGKTTIAKFISEFIYNEAGKHNVPHGEVLYAAYTGKAASRLRVKGCKNAQTLHSQVYKPRIDFKTNKCIGFELNRMSVISECAVLVIDEMSFVDEELGLDVMSFNKSVIVLGDPAQLQPVNGPGYFTKNKPDYLMTEITRQAKDSPIIHLATRARNHKIIKPGRYGNCTVYEEGTYLPSKTLASYDQVLVGTNNSRRTINTKIRKQNGKFAKGGVFPVRGDRLMCLRNNKNAGLYNGTTWTSSLPTIGKVMQPVSKNSPFLREGSVDVLKFKIRSEDEYDMNDELIILNVQCSLHMFDSSIPEPHWRDIQGCDDFTFGSAATVHKFQGSEAPRICLIDESSVFRLDKFNHLYTGITRASELIDIYL
jgi:exodeoxyribonuclease-5